MKEKINKYLYYIVIGVVSVLVLMFFPLMGSSADLKLNFPSTVGGWIVYIGTLLFTSLGNMMIFFSFMEQAKINIKDEPSYKKADEIMIELAIKDPHKQKAPISPKKWTTLQYTRKGTLIFLGSGSTCFALTNAILKFDVMTFIAYLIAITFSVIFGIFQMKYSERFWTTDYLRYAEYELRAFKEQTEVNIDDNNKQRN